MRAVRNMFILALLTVFCSSTLPLQAQPSLEWDSTNQWMVSIEEQLKEQGAELEAYRETIQQLGEELFAEESAQLKRAQAQEFHNAAQILREQITEEAQEGQELLQKELLYQQLQLIFVDLDENARQEKMEIIANIEKQRQEALEEAEQKLGDALQELAADYEELGEKELQNLRTKVEQAMEQEYIQFHSEQLAQLEEEIAKLGPKLRSAFLNRSY